MNKEVHAATEADLDFIYDTLRADLDEQGVLYRFKYTEKEFKNALFGKYPIAHFLILFIDGQHAGFANFSIDNRNFTANYLPNLYLNDLYVCKPYRRTGYARLLFTKLKEIAKQEKCGRIEWLVQKENEQAIAFYKTIPNTRIIESLHYM